MCPGAIEMGHRGAAVYISEETAKSLNTSWKLGADDPDASLRSHRAAVLYPAFNRAFLMKPVLFGLAPQLVDL